MACAEVVQGAATRGDGIVILDISCCDLGPCMLCWPQAGTALAALDAAHLPRCRRVRWLNLACMPVPSVDKEGRASTLPRCRNFAAVAALMLHVVRRWREFTPAVSKLSTSMLAWGDRISPLQQASTMARSEGCAQKQVCGREQQY